MVVLVTCHRIALRSWDFDVIALPVAHGEGRFVGTSPHPNPSPIATGEGLWSSGLRCFFGLGFGDHDGFRSSGRGFAWGIDAEDGTDGDAVKGCTAFDGDIDLDEEVTLLADG